MVGLLTQLETHFNHILNINAQKVEDETFQMKPFHYELFCLQVAEHSMQRDGCSLNANSYFRLLAGDLGEVKRLDYITVSVLINRKLSS